MTYPLQFLPEAKYFICHTQPFKETQGSSEQTNLVFVGEFETYLRELGETFAVINCNMLRERTGCLFLFVSNEM